MTNYLKMTLKELDINTIMDKLVKKECNIKEASNRIYKSERQVKRIKKRYILEGSLGIIHKSRGMPSNNKTDDSKYIEAIQIVKTEYSDYGATLASEKLAKKHNIIIPVSTLRLQMIKAGIWKYKIRKKPDKQFTARPRKDTYGEMIQYDGSYHKWFEGRKDTEYQCLLVAIDDATGEVTAKFAINEGTTETFKFWKEYIETKGKPSSIYLDKFSTYKINYPGATDDKELPTQFGKTCNKLGIKLIFANSPQAKGRVERMNKTLQDRLVKDLREYSIADIETANIFLREVFLPEFNKQFMVEAKSDSNLHLKLRTDEILNIDQIFSTSIQRKIANDYTVKFNNKYFQLFREKDGGYMIKSGYTVDIETHLNGDIKISKNGIYIRAIPSFDRPNRLNNLMTAPIFENKKEISLKSDISNLTQMVTF